MHALALALRLIAETPSATTETGGAGFWAGVGLASVIATAVATGVSTVAAIWWRVHDRAEADWVFMQPRASWTQSSDGHAVLVAELSNAGDGPAFQAEVSSSHGKASLRGEPVTTSEPSFVRRNTGGPDLGSRVPLLRPGDAVRLVVNVPGSLWEIATIDIAWTPTPTRKRRRLTTHVPLREICERPQYGKWDSDEHGNAQFVPLPEPSTPPQAAMPTAPPPRTKAGPRRRSSRRRRQP